MKKGMTVKQAAAVMNVSVTMVRLAGAVQRSRPDLAAEVMAGRMKVSEAYRIATGKPKPTRVERMLATWRNASPDEQMEFLAAISGE